MIIIHMKEGEENSSSVLETPNTCRVKKRRRCSNFSSSKAKKAALRRRKERHILALEHAEDDTVAVLGSIRTQGLEVVEESSVEDEEVLQSELDALNETETSRVREALIFPLYRQVS